MCIVLRASNKDTKDEEGEGWTLITVGMLTHFQSQRSCMTSESYLELFMVKTQHPPLDPCQGTCLVLDSCTLLVTEIYQRLSTFSCPGFGLFLLQTPLPTCLFGLRFALAEMHQAGSHWPDSQSFSFSDGAMALSSTASEFDSLRQRPD